MLAIISVAGTRALTMRRDYEGQSLELGRLLRIGRACPCAWHNYFGDFEFFADKRRRTKNRRKFAECAVAIPGVSNARQKSNTVFFTRRTADTARISHSFAVLLAVFASINHAPGRTSQAGHSFGLKKRVEKTGEEGGWEAAEKKK